MYRNYLILVLPALLTFGLSPIFVSCSPDVAMDKIGRGPAGDASASSPLTRASAQMLALRIKSVFPDFPSDTLTTGKGLGKFLGQADFVTNYHSQSSFSAVAQTTFRNAIAPYCARAVGAQNNLFDIASVLMAGETAPSDPVARDALAAARNGWLFPYTAASSEVQTLVSVYRDEIAAHSTDVQAHQTLCMAIYLSPQFWLGNPGPADVIRRLAFNIGQRLPTFREFDDFSNGRLTASQYVKVLQAEPGYLTAVKGWHREWTGAKNLQSYFTERLGDFRGEKYNFGHGGATGMGGQTMVYMPLPGADPTVSTTSTVKLVLAAQNSFPYYSSTLRDSENCDDNLYQPFDPRTDEVRWQQFNPVNSRWELIGSYNKVGAAWQMNAGSITAADGSSHITTHLSDLTNAEAVTIPGAPEGSPPVFQYLTASPHYNRITSHWDLTPSALYNSPLRQFTADHLRVTRAFQHVDQVGYDYVKMWYSGQPQRVCNNLSRFVAACAFRPGPAPDPTQPWFSQIYGHGDGITPLFESDWNATVPVIDLIGSQDGTTFNKNAFAHPTIIDAMSCGIPQPDAAMEAAAYPKTPPYNDLALNTRVGLANLATNEVRSDPEQIAVQKIVSDMNSEPDALVADIVGGQKDYRLLLTAPYTFGSGGLELLYRSQAYYLPKYPPGQAIPGSPDYDRTRQIQSSQFSPIPKKWMQNGYTAPNSYGPYLSGWKVVDQITPRPMSGLLTQAAFLAPAGYKMRSVAARIFQTFTCGDVNGFVPDKAQMARHLPFVPHYEAGGAAHVDPKLGCIHCHINMDPLASSLSTGFLDLNLVYPDAWNALPYEHLAADGEMIPYYNGDLLANFTYGIRGMDVPSHGAVMGQHTSGVQDVGRVLANSDQFAQCAAQKAFQGVFGRVPASDAPAEAAVVKDAAAILKFSNYNYNSMVESIATSRPFLQEN